MPGYISEVDYDGGAASNFVEVVVPASIDASNYTLVVYDKDGTIIETYLLGDPVTEIAGDNVFLLDNNTVNWVDIHNDEALALVDDTGTVLQFISFKNAVTAVEGPANGTTSTQIGQHSGGNKSLFSIDGGNSYSPTTTSTPGTIPCYAPGTLIATPDGPCPVECLQPGDLVTVFDGPPAEILWISARETFFVSDTDDRLPVLIMAGALGPNCPQHDLIVSPQHRLLVGGRGNILPEIAEEILVPAKALVGLPGICRVTHARHITWHHFACARHNVVRAEGCYSESLLLGPMVLNRLPDVEKQKLARIFGRQRDDGPLNGPPARPCLRAGQAVSLIRSARQGRTHGTRSMQPA